MPRANLKAGDTISIGEAAVEIVEDADADLAAGKFSMSAAGDDALLSAYFNNALANSNEDAVAGSAMSGANVKFDGANLTVSAMEADDVTAAQHAEAFAVSTTGERDTETTTGGLTLQIGDTSDEYNQLTVSVSDMHTSTLGLDEVDISTQEGAQAAINIIKNAINSVSSTRGDLGALQNRLDHTSNNLAIMEENITNAESNIRDTDVAEEMMAYTKNNILIQSAQAMLAQANMLPQGVLQLLG